MGANELKIVFYKSSSINYDYALVFAKKFKNYTQNGKVNEVKIPLDEIYKKIPHIEKLVDYIKMWKYTEITFNNKKIGGINIRDLLGTIQCVKEYRKPFDEDTYCYLYEPHNDKREGWHCRRLYDMQRYIPATYYQFTTNRCSYWFNFGHFEENVWVINKQLIKQKLIEESETKFLNLCPYFRTDNIDNILNSFPDSIDVDNNKDWIIREEEVNTGYSLEKIKAGIMPQRVIDQRDNQFSGYVRLVENAINNTEPRYIPDVTFNDIGGLGDTVTVIREVIELPILKPELFEHLGIAPHKGILLYGQPGCGKTLIAKAIANEIQAHFINIKGPELFNKYIGQSEKNLRNVFEEAREHSPSIIFFDEIDAIAQKRSSDDSVRHVSIFVNQLLTLMDGVEEYSNVCIIASTNRPELLDEAILRPGRFDYHIEIKKPTLAGCKEILKICTSKMPIAESFNTELFTEKLVGCTGADIQFVSTEAAYNCLRRNGKSYTQLISSQLDLNEFLITEQDFTNALIKLQERND
jgi:ATP-dependent 26S proteasome regulatory subunit